MSGPKVDVAELRRQEQMRLEAARENRKRLASKIKKQINQLESYMNSELEFLKRDEFLKKNYNEILTFRTKCCKELQELWETVKAGNELLDVDNIEKKADGLLDEYQKKVKEQSSIISKLVHSNEQYQQLQKQNEALKQVKKKKIVRLLSKTENVQEKVKEEVANTVSEEEVTELADTFGEEVKEFMSETKMTSRHKNSILLIHQDLQDIMESSVDTDRKAMRIKSLYGEYQKMTSKITREMEELEVYYQEYLKETFDLSAPVMDISDFSSKEAIEQAIKIAKENASAHLSKEYIKRQIDEVMAKNGYDVVKSDLLSEVEESGRVLYGVNNDTAIDVFVSDENQVTMRVVGIGFDSDISAEEDEKLFQQQCAFCSMHPKITAELAMRGVILHTKKHMEPDKRFNKKIQTKNGNSSQTNSRAKKEMKRTELKKMYKE